MHRQVVFKGGKALHDLLGLVRGAFYRNGYALTDSDATLMVGSLPEEDKRKLSSSAKKGRDEEVLAMLQPHYVALPTRLIEGMKILPSAQKHEVCSVCHEEIPPDQYYLFLKGAEPSHTVGSGNPVLICESCLAQGARVCISVDLEDGGEEEEAERAKDTPADMVAEDQCSSLFFTLRKEIKAILPNFGLSMKGNTVYVGGYYELRFPFFPSEQVVELWGGGIKVRNKRIRDVKSAIGYIKDSLDPSSLAKDTRKLVNAVVESRVPSPSLGEVVHISGLTRNRIGLLLSIPSSGNEDLISLIEVSGKLGSEGLDRPTTASIDSVYIAADGLYSPDVKRQQVVYLKWKA